MNVHTETLSLSTEEDSVSDITREVERIVRDSGIKEGICLVFVPHSTAFLVLNENEHGLLKDYLKSAYKLIPKKEDYEHDRIDNNAHAHLKSAFFGSERILPISNGRLERGTWQNILLLETEGPRSRRVIVKAMGVG